jgi:hypothetical protein
VDQQCLGRVAGRGALDLRVDGDRNRVVEVCAGVDEHVAIAARGIDHGDGGVLLERCLEALSPARDH